VAILQIGGAARPDGQGGYLVMLGRRVVDRLAALRGATAT